MTEKRKTIRGREVVAMETKVEAETFRSQREQTWWWWGERGGRGLTRLDGVSYLGPTHTGQPWELCS